MRKHFRSDVRFVWERDDHPCGADVKSIITLRGAGNVFGQIVQYTYDPKRYKDASDIFLAKRVFDNPHRQNEQRKFSNLAVAMTWIEVGLRSFVR